MHGFHCGGIRAFVFMRAFVSKNNVTVLIIFSVLLTVGAATPESGKKVEAKTCLACHGPFDKIAEVTADFKTSSGEPVTPHQYIPHNEKTQANIPQCINCHKPHEMPPQGRVEKPQNVDWCYARCHHMRNLQKCTACHNETPKMN